MALAKFGTMPDGSEVSEVTISAGQLSVKVINLGAVIRDIRLAGVDHPLVLGFDRLEDYVAHSPHFGAVAGRSANRIANGRFMLDGREVQLSRNEGGRTHLHGGFNGFGKRVWRLVEHDAASLKLAISSPDGEEGYPGHVEAMVRYSDQYVRVVAEKLLTYALGRGTGSADMPVVRAIVRGAAGSNYRFSDLVLGVVKSVPFQMNTKETTKALASNQ